MAKAIKQIQRIEISEEDQRRKDLLQVEDALIKNKEAILESLQVLGHMQDRGVLSLLNGLFGQGDKVLDVLVKTADTPETTNLLKNLLLMGGLLGTLNVQQLEPFILKINSGIARVAETKDNEDSVGYFDFARSLKDPEINKSVSLLLNFLKGMGEDTEGLERTTQPPEKQIQQQMPREKHGMHERD
ncbi:MULTISPECIES: DUF1641 domain-containing protein [unclassified Bacillus (in: firmicutes)]|uniref:DUF1641 domain-containing protein n=1 Tax=unclassified Bacillus (in: firmicutes) TaxID=185979 RepID=UPI000E3C8721|nr:MULTISPECIES: DUF1641 domain-containing protein [unclassified Bacillus (in: firmicutes)]RFU68191.1 DUF1641 domain-containing protein [Bacillus sp. V59.32b]CAH0347103.1 hypothetical protein BCI9360_03476 [Bacillus sp. CECT 9360]